MELRIFLSRPDLDVPAGVSAPSPPVRARQDVPSPVQSAPPGPPPGPPGLPPPDSETQPGLNQAKMARQEQLVKKLSGMLVGTDEELIKSCIAELRAKHGKLSGEGGRGRVLRSTNQLCYRLAYEQDCDSYCGYDEGE